MGRLFLILAAMAAFASSLLAADFAMAKDHRNGWERGGGERGAPAWAGGPGRGGPPGWAGPPVRYERAPGRYERIPNERPPSRYDRGPVMPERGYIPAPRGYAPAPRAYAPRRGAYLPPEARGGVVQDYGRYRLRPPPPGYGWVRSGRALMLMDMNTGQVFDVIPY